MLKYFQCQNDEIILNTPQINASVLMFKNNKHTKNYLEEFIKTIVFDPYLITDKYEQNQMKDLLKIGMTKVFQVL